MIKLLTQRLSGSVLSLESPATYYASSDHENGSSCFSPDPGPIEKLRDLIGEVSDFPKRSEALGHLELLERHLSDADLETEQARANCEETEEELLQANARVDALKERVAYLELQVRGHSRDRRRAQRFALDLEKRLRSLRSEMDLVVVDEEVVVSEPEEEMDLFEPPLLSPEESREFLSEVVYGSTDIYGRLDYKTMDVESFIDWMIKVGAWDEERATQANSVAAQHVKESFERWLDERGH